MGQLSSRAKPHPRMERKDALTLCESGDLLLLRDRVEHAAMQLALDPIVARDIAGVQHGQFPSQRVTVLPGAIG